MWKINENITFVYGSFCFSLLEIFLVKVVIILNIERKITAQKRGVEPSFK